MVIYWSPLLFCTSKGILLAHPLLALATYPSVVLCLLGVCGCLHPLGGDLSHVLTTPPCGLLTSTGHTSLLYGGGFNHVALLLLPTHSTAAFAVSYPHSPRLLLPSHAHTVHHCFCLLIPTRSMAAFALFCPCGLGLFLAFSPQGRFLFGAFYSVPPSLFILGQLGFELKLCSLSNQHLSP